MSGSLVLVKLAGVGEADEGANAALALDLDVAFAGALLCADHLVAAGREEGLARVVLALGVLHLHGVVQLHLAVCVVSCVAHHGRVGRLVPAEDVRVGERRVLVLDEHVGACARDRRLQVLPLLLCRRGQVRPLVKVRVRHPHVVHRLEVRGRLRVVAVDRGHVIYAVLQVAKEHARSVGHCVHRRFL